MKYTELENALLKDLKDSVGTSDFRDVIEQLPIEEKTINQIVIDFCMEEIREQLIENFNIFILEESEANKLRGDKIEKVIKDYLTK